MTGGFSFDVSDDELYWDNGNRYTGPELYQECVYDLLHKLDLGTILNYLLDHEEPKDLKELLTDYIQNEYTMSELIAMVRPKAERIYEDE